MLRFSGSGQSHVGLVRSNNEDSAFAGPYVALVADGVGGAAAGEIASATAAYVVSAMAIGRIGTDPETLLREAVALAHESLAIGVAQDPSRSGMATTLTAVVCDGERFLMAHVGDSRGYLWRDGALTRITHDHTWVQSLVDAGTITPEQVRTHPHRSVVLRSLAADHPAEVDIIELALRPGDQLLLCSDGLSDLVAEPDIAAVLRTHADAEDAAAALILAALQAGGHDNVTAVLTDVVESPRVCADGQLIGAVRDVGNVVDPAAVHLVSA